VRGVGYFICVFGFVDEVLRRHTPLPHSHRIERSDPPALFEMKCRRRPHLVHVVILPFGAENLYEPKERLLITQKRGIDRGVRLEDSELPGFARHEQDADRPPLAGAGPFAFHNS
jgi:hypothetical protein